MKPARILFVDDEEDLRFAAEQSLRLDGLDVVSFADPEQALAHVSPDFDGILITDIRMPRIDGLELMRRALLVDPAFPVVLVTGHGDIDLAVQSMRAGAYDFIEKPFEPARLVETARRALDKRHLTLENRALRSRVSGEDALEARLAGRSQIMERLRQQIAAVAQTEADVLITGETGTGKEVTARALHDLSPRADHPFVHINCAALPADLIESELFGHEAGAFPGAVRARYGKFEHARRGTVFLDEIDVMPAPLQAKLLHAVQNRTITRLGSNEDIELDVRFIAASKSDLEDAAVTGRFRSDLLYRLNVVTLSLPSLEARREDVPRLFQLLVARAAERFKRPVPEVPAAVLALVSARSWPGNVRELCNAADRFVLGLDLALGQAKPTDRQTLAEQMAAHEKALIAACLAAHAGSLKETYESLGLSRKALYEKMQKYGLSREDFVFED